MQHRPQTSVGLSEELIALVVVLAENINARLIRNVKTLPISERAGEKVLSVEIK